MKYSTTLTVENHEDVSRRSSLAFPSSYSNEWTKKKKKHENFWSLLHSLSLCLKMSSQKKEARDWGAWGPLNGKGAGVHGSPIFMSRMAPGQSNMRSSSRVLLINLSILLERNFQTMASHPASLVFLTEGPGKRCHLNGQDVGLLPAWGRLPQPLRKRWVLTSWFHGLHLSPSGQSAACTSQPAHFPRSGLGTTVIMSIYWAFVMVVALLKSSSHG